MIQIQDNSRTNNDDLPVQTNVASQATPNPVPANSNDMNQATPVMPVAPTQTSTVSAPEPLTPVTDNPIQGLVGDMKANNDQTEFGVVANQGQNKDLEAKSQASEAEINDLLAQLEKLSREIETKAETDTKTMSSSSPKQEQVSHSTPVNNEFDMDKFLKDLEEKIEKDQSSEDDEPAFRKNRVVDRGGVEFDEDEASIPVQTTPKPVKTESIPSTNRQDLVKEVDELLDEAMKMKGTDENDNKVSPTSETKELENSIDEISDVEPDAKVNEELEEKEELPQSLEAQSVFEMLNIDDITADEREEFLNELEELIWEDFIKTDLPLMLTNDEYKGAEEILNSQKNENQKKEELLVYVEKILPDIEEIMYEKAIGLKEEMFMERVRKMEEAGAGDQDVLTVIEQVKKLVQVGQWKTAVETLNQA